MTQSYEERLFSVNDLSFEQLALEVFRFQFQRQSIYRYFCMGLGKTPENVITLSDIPFLPISFFKTHPIICEGKAAEAVFESSGTTGSHVSKHWVADTSLYIESFTRCFRLFYGAPQHYHILALLPSYAQRKSSSLVVMAEHLMRQSNKPENGFFMNDFQELAARLAALEFQQQPTILLGVTYALLDFAEQFPMKLHHTIVMETGGMKGRKKEMLRAEVHKKLTAAFGLSAIHAEYGMTELLSQSYSQGNGIFRTPQWMKVLVRDVYDPMSISGENRSGALNVIDLANVYSCSFIATDDFGTVYENGTFEVLGRLENSDIRGCNLLYTQ
jgi:phenylacetate-coenzyme A ligase PaaK-like adenylate-forming protein